MRNLTRTTLVATLLLVPTSLAFGSPAELSLEELDRFTAGSASPAPNGGAIIGNGSAAALQSGGEVRLDGEAQSAARALNLVNGSESTVANGVNIFDGSVVGVVEAAEGAYEIQQSNTVMQDQRRLASLPDYTRGANEETTSTTTTTTSGSTDRTLFDQVVDIDRHTVIDEVVTDGGMDRTSAPTLRIDAMGALSTPDGFMLNGELGVEFNTPSAAQSVGVVFNGGIDFTVDGGDIEIDTGDLGVTLDVGLPELGLVIDAMGCVAVNGNCRIAGSRTESEETLRDLSTLYTLDESSTSSSETMESTHTVTHAPFELKDGQAEYIVVDDSHIDVTAEYVVSLAGGSQSSLRGLNVVNAAGSAVANGVNISKLGAGDQQTGARAFELSQMNHITHSR